MPPIGVRTASFFALILLFGIGAGLAVYGVRRSRKKKDESAPAETDGDTVSTSTPEAGDVSDGQVTSSESKPSLTIDCAPEGTTSDDDEPSAIGLPDENPPEIPSSPHSTSAPRNDDELPPIGEGSPTALNEPNIEEMLLANDKEKLATIDPSILIPALLETDGDTVSTSTSEASDVSDGRVTSSESKPSLTIDCAPDGTTSDDDEPSTIGLPDENPPEIPSSPLSTSAPCNDDELTQIGEGSPANSNDLSIEELLLANDKEKLATIDPSILIPALLEILAGNPDLDSNSRDLAMSICIENINLISSLESNLDLPKRLVELVERHRTAEKIRVALRAVFDIEGNIERCINTLCRPIFNAAVKNKENLLPFVIEAIRPLIDSEKWNDRAVALIRFACSEASKFAIFETSDGWNSTILETAGPFFDDEHVVVREAARQIALESCLTMPHSVQRISGSAPFANMLVKLLIPVACARLPEKDDLKESEYSRLEKTKTGAIEILGAMFGYDGPSPSEAEAFAPYVDDLSVLIVEMAKDERKKMKTHENLFFALIFAQKHLGTSGNHWMQSWRRLKESCEGESDELEEELTDNFTNCAFERVNKMGYDGLSDHEVECLTEMLEVMLEEQMKNGKSDKVLDGVYVIIGALFEEIGNKFCPYFARFAEIVFSDRHAFRLERFFDLMDTVIHKVPEFAVIYEREIKESLNATLSSDCPSAFENATAAVCFMVYTDRIEWHDLASSSIDHFYSSIGQTKDPMIRKWAVAAIVRVLEHCKDIDMDSRLPQLIDLMDRWSSGDESYDLFVYEFLLDLAESKHIAIANPEVSTKLRSIFVKGLDLNFGLDNRSYSPEANGVKKRLRAIVAQMSADENLEQSISRN